MSNSKFDKIAQEEMSSEVGVHELESLKKKVIDNTYLLFSYKDDENPIIQSIVIEGLRKAGSFLEDFYSIIIEESQANVSVTPENLEDLASLASELDKIGDPWLTKQAAVLDEILLTIGADKADVTAARHAQDEEILRIKSLAGKEEINNPYTAAKAAHDKFNQVAETKKVLDKVKTYRPMEAILSTRTCPDHPGAQMARIGESTYQCSLDKGIYNHENGYTTMNGNHVPGGDISNQTQELHDRPNEFTSFDTRESKLNPTS